MMSSSGTSPTFPVEDAKLDSTDGNQGGGDVTRPGAGKGMTSKGVQLGALLTDVILSPQSCNKGDGLLATPWSELEWLKTSILQAGLILVCAL